MGIEVSGRLISEDDIWVMDKSPSDTDSLRFSSGKRLNEAFLFMKKPNARQYFWNLL